MNTSEFIQAGTLTRTIGLKGALQLKLNTDFKRLYNRIETFFIEIGGQPVPFFIQKITLKQGDTLIVELEDVETEEEAKRLVNSPVMVSTDILPTVSGNEFFHHEIIGYTVVDNTAGPLGPVIDVLDVPMQTVIAVEHRSKEVLIPLAGHILQRINRDTKTIEVSCPEGLVDLYLGNAANELPEDGHDDGPTT